MYHLFWYTLYFSDRWDGYGFWAEGLLCEIAAMRHVVSNHIVSILFWSVISAISSIAAKLGATAISFICPLGLHPRRNCTWSIWPDFSINFIIVSWLDGTMDWWIISRMVWHIFHSVLAIHFVRLVFVLYSFIFVLKLPFGPTALSNCHFTHWSDQGMVRSLICHFGHISPWSSLSLLPCIWSGTIAYSRPIAIWTKTEMLISPRCQVPMHYIRNGKKKNWRWRVYHRQMTLTEELYKEQMGAILQIMVILLPNPLICEPWRIWAVLNTLLFQL